MGLDIDKMAGVLKKATGLTGLAVAKNPHQTLKILYEKTLRTLQKMPQEAKYKQFTEQIVGQRLALVKSEPNVKKLETKINCGQIEEVILQAERELILSRKILSWRAWEPLQTKSPYH